MNRIIIIMNIWLFFILFLLIFSFTLETIVSFLNLKSLSSTLPPDFKNVYDNDKYSESQKYTQATTKFSLLENGFSTGITVLFLLFGGFNIVDIWARNLGYGGIITGLIFCTTLLFLSFLSNFPFSVYSTFIIEEQFGFNRTTIKTFILDTIKTIILSLLLGLPLLALILWFFTSSGPYGWFYCWVGVFTFTLILQFLAPILIMPLFNKFSPIEDGPLKTGILRYADEEKFKIQGIYTMDGSKRSSKLNAFFTGFGSFRKIVFYDTLIEKLETPEIVAVLAHEMGHFKLRHIIKMITGSAIQIGIMFYLLSLFLQSKGLSEAFGMDHMSIYSSLIFFGFIFSPVSMLISIIFNGISRKHEFEADRYAAESTNQPEMLIEGLKKLTVANLSNLTPHPLHVFLHYSHPPVLMRIRKLQQLKTGITQ
jgi:STE24 endopeptidase